MVKLSVNIMKYQKNTIIYGPYKLYDIIWTTKNCKRKLFDILTSWDYDIDTDFVK